MATYVPMSSGYSTNGGWQLPPYVADITFESREVILIAMRNTSTFPFKQKEDSEKVPKLQGDGYSYVIAKFCSRDALL